MNFWSLLGPWRVAMSMRNKFLPCLSFAAVFLASTSQFGWNRALSEPVATSATYTLDTPIEVIAADPGGTGVLNKDIPGLLANSHYESFKGMTLKVLAALSGGRLSRQTLAQTELDLAALKARAAGSR